MAIKPILTCAASLWFNTKLVSSYQIDRLRRFERKWLRHAANFHKERGKYKYKHSGLLYQAASIRRLDALICQNIISFFRRCESKPKPIIKSLADVEMGGKYKTNQIHRMNKNNELLDLFINFYILTRKESAVFLFSPATNKKLNLVKRTHILRAHIQEKMDLKTLINETMSNDFIVIL